MKSESVPVLRLQDVRVRFPGIVAVDLPELALFDRSRIALLLGPNGAGKSSLINAATGYAAVRPPGQIVLNNGTLTKLNGLTRDRIVQAGVARTFQMPVIFSSLTVEESLLLAAVLAKPTAWHNRLASLLRPLRQNGEAARFVQCLIEEFDLAPVAKAQMNELPFVMLRRAELARALAVQPRILFLDEPSAGADDAEARFLTSLISKRIPEIITSYFNKGMYRYPELAIGLVTHDRALLTGLARSCADAPIAYCFDRGQFKSSCTLNQWLDSTQTQ